MVCVCRLWSAGVRRTLPVYALVTSSHTSTVQPSRVCYTSALYHLRHNGLQRHEQSRVCCTYRSSLWFCPVARPFASRPLHSAAVCRSISTTVSGVVQPTGQWLTQQATPLSGTTIKVGRRPRISSFGRASGTSRIPRPIGHRRHRPSMSPRTRFLTYENGLLCKFTSWRRHYVIKTFVCTSKVRFHRSSF